MKNKNKYEIIIYGRGGQGVKTTAEILAQAALLENKKIQAFPEFGPERSGAPVRSFVIISDKGIITHQPIKDPDCVLVLDDSILNFLEVDKNLTEGEPLIINSKRDRLEIKQKIKSSANIVTVDASGISEKIIGIARPNTVILGKFSLVTEAVQLENIITAFRNKYQEKIGKEQTEKNIQAIETAYGVHNE